VVRTGNSGWRFEPCLTHFFLSVAGAVVGVVLLWQDVHGTNLDFLKNSFSLLFSVHRSVKFLIIDRE
jgi:hypothetical protein